MWYFCIHCWPNEWNKSTFAFVCAQLQSSIFFFSFLSPSRSNHLTEKSKQIWTLDKIMIRFSMDDVVCSFCSSSSPFPNHWMLWIASLHSIWKDFPPLDTHRIEVRSTFCIPVLVWKYFPPEKKTFRKIQTCDDRLASAVTSRNCYSFKWQPEWKFQLWLEFYGDVTRFIVCICSWNWKLLLPFHLHWQTPMVLAECRNSNTHGKQRQSDFSVNVHTKYVIAVCNFKLMGWTNDIDR